MNPDLEVLSDDVRAVATKLLQDLRVDAFSRGLPPPVIDVLEDEGEADISWADITRHKALVFKVCSAEDGVEVSAHGMDGDRSMTLDAPVESDLTRLLDWYAGLDSFDGLTGGQDFRTVDPHVSPV